MLQNIRNRIARRFIGWAARIDPTVRADKSPAIVTAATLADPRDVTKGAATEAEARALYASAKERDPFPDIPPALLNSAHIEDYMLHTGMVYPYQPERRKSAAYAMRVGSGVAFRNPDTERQEVPVRQLGGRQLLELPPNSITYVQTKELFQLPNYMAVRFNLHIDLVHKGLLLGTGPLVDPGFSGRLVVPLHNMTANTYYLAENDEFIWVEFTKTSMNEAWLVRRKDPERPVPKATFENFPKDKTNLPIEDYFKRALRPHPSRVTDGPSAFPVNAIPAAVAEAARNAMDARKDARDARRTIKRIAWGSGIGAGIAAVALIFGPIQTTVSAIGMVDAATQRVRALEIQVAELREPLTNRAIEAARRNYCRTSGSDARSTQQRVLALGSLRAAQRDANNVARTLNKPPPYPLDGGSGTSGPPVDCSII